MSQTHLEHPVFQIILISIIFNLIIFILILIFYNSIENLTLVSNRVVIQWFVYFRDVCTNHLILNPRQIGGVGIQVQIDETLIAKRKYNRGRHVEQRWLVGGVCPEQGRGFVQSVPDRSRVTLDPILMKHIAPGSNIRSDGWAAYITNIGQPNQKSHLEELPVNPKYTHEAVSIHTF